MTQWSLIGYQTTISSLCHCLSVSCWHNGHPTRFNLVGPIESHGASPLTTQCYLVFLVFLWPSFVFSGWLLCLSECAHRSLRLFLEPPFHSFLCSTASQNSSIWFHQVWCNPFFDQNFGPHAGAQHIALATLVGILGRTVYWQIQPGDVMPNGLSKFSEMVVSGWISPQFQGPR